MNAFLKNLCCISLFPLLSLPLSAQAPGPVALGAQFGQPTGLSLRIVKPNGSSLDLLAAWDLDDYLFFNLHFLKEYPLAGAGQFNWFVGPGVFLALRDRGRRSGNNDTDIGISGTIGLNVYLDPVEIYLRLSPRLQVIDETNGAIGGGLGFRYYF